MHKTIQVALLPPIYALAQISFAAPQVSDGEKLYDEFCSGCHGKELEGGSAGSLIDKNWQDDVVSARLTATISQGRLDLGMPAFGETLKAGSLDQLVDFITDKASRAQAGADGRPAQPSVSHNFPKPKFELERLAEFDGTPWAIDFLPDGELIITERGGKLWLFDGTRLSNIENPPEVWAYGQGGLLEVKPHPNYLNNGWIYLSLSEGSFINGGMTKIVRGKIKDGKWVDEELIYSVDQKYYTSTRVHFGSRIVLAEGYIFFTVGDRGQREDAQDLGKPNGKIHRLHEDGRVPDDNPFVNRRRALSSIWSYGHRNPQGLVLDKKTGLLWETEHGPKGGDELNIIEKGLNYGWPAITYGVNYSGTSITPYTHKAGMEQPQHYWVPSIATAGIDIYYGDIFPAWNGKLFVSGMASASLQLLTVDGRKVVSEEAIIEDRGRVRDVAVSPIGDVYVLLNSRSNGNLYRLKPN